MFGPALATGLALLCYRACQLLYRFQICWEGNIRRQMPLKVKQSLWVHGVQTESSSPAGAVKASAHPKPRGLWGGL